jgi:hypothetical protein
MSRAYLGGFVVIAAVAVGAADYINQSRRAGTAPGAFGASDYVATISGRVLGRQTAPAAAPARGGPPAPEPGSVLPEEPEGGTGRGGGAEAVVDAAESGTGPASAPAGGGILSMVGGLFGGGGSTPDAATPAKVRPVASSGGFGGDCSVTMGVKRCSSGGN